MTQLTAHNYKKNKNAELTAGIVCKVKKTLRLTQFGTFLVKKIKKITELYC
jgi:hypothetical protein